MGDALTAPQFNDCVNAAVLAMDGKISRENARLTAKAVLEAYGLRVPRWEAKHDR